MSNAVPDVPDDGGFADRLKGKAKQVLGTVVRDDDLRVEGELQETKADAAAQARKDVEAAEREIATAEIAARENELRVERAQIAAEEVAAAERAELDRQRAADEARLEHQVQAEQVATAHQAAASEAAADNKETRAVVERLAAEAEAQRIEHAAQQAKRNAAVLDQAQNKD